MISAALTGARHRAGASSTTSEARLPSKPCAPVLPAVQRDLKGSFQGDIEIGIDVDVKVHVDIARYLVIWLFKGGFKVSLGTSEWCRSGYGTDFHNSEISRRTLSIPGPMQWGPFESTLGVASWLCFWIIRRSSLHNTLNTCLQPSVILVILLLPGNVRTV